MFSRGTLKHADLSQVLQFEGSARTEVGIPVKVNADSGGKPNGIPERR
jgi:hypothetical protein